VTRAHPLGLPGRVIRASTALAVVVGVVTGLGASQALASQPLTYVQTIGRPLHTAPEGVATTAAGDVYVAEPDVIGSTPTKDRVVKYDADGNLLTVLAGPGTALGQVDDPTSVAVAPPGAPNAGDVYVTEQGTDRVQYWDASGSYLGHWGANGSGNGQFANPQGIDVDSLGNVYVADTSNGRVQKFDSAGNWLDAWASTGAAEIAVDSTDVLWVVGSSTIKRFDTSGNLLGGPWTFTGAAGVDTDTSDNAWITNSTSIREYDPTGTLLNTYGSSGTGDGQLSGAQGIAVGSGGDFFVADAGNSRIQRFSSAGAYETQWGAYAADTGSLDTPTGLATDASGNVYVTNKASDVIQEFASNGSFIRAIGGSGNGDGQLHDPEGVSVDASGNVYIADTLNQRIEVFDNTGAYVRQWGSFGTNNGQFSSPKGIVVTAGGKVYVVDYGNSRIQEFDTSGNFLNAWGTVGGGDGQFKSPKGIAIDGSGHVWVADSANNRLQEFTAGGVFMNKFGSVGTADGKFTQPTGLAFDSDGTVWVTDTNNSRVERFDVAGTFGQYLSTLGSLGLDLGQFDHPAGIAVDPTGRLVVADTNNERLEVFVDENGPDTIITSGPGTVTNQSGASFSFYASEPGSTFECKRDAGSWNACTSPASVAGLPEGSHTFSIRATDPQSHVGDATDYTWSIDTTPPTASVTSSPTSPTKQLTSSFSFTSTELPATFQCKVDSGVFASCVSPKSATVSSQGTHTFYVKATDQAGNTSVAASSTWTVDTTPPTVAITQAPSSWSTSTNATFKFADSADTGGTDTFQCQLDSGTALPCSSPTSYSSLGAGLHTFRVKATDKAGNIGSWAQATWTVDTGTHRPDALIATGTSYIGNGIYNTTGTNQTKTLKGKTGKTLVFKVRIENDSSDEVGDPFKVLGTKAGKGYTVGYYDGTASVTTKVTAGTYSVSLDPGAYKILTVKITVGSSAAAKRAFLITVSAAHDPTKVDAVKAVAKLA